MNIFNEVNEKGNLIIGHSGNDNLINTIPRSRDPDNKSGIAPLSWPSGLALHKTTAGIIKQGEASNLHGDQLPYPINEIIFDGVEPRHEITDELLFVKPQAPPPPREYALLSNHELEMRESVYPDGTPRHMLQPDPIHIRQDVYRNHLLKLKDIEKIENMEVKDKVRKTELQSLLVQDPQLYTALYNRQTVIEEKVVEQAREEIQEIVEEEEVKEDLSLEEDIIDYSYNRVIGEFENEAFIAAIKSSNFSNMKIKDPKVAVSLVLIQDMMDSDLGMMNSDDFEALVEGRYEALDKRIFKKDGVNFSVLKKKLFPVRREVIVKQEKPPPLEPSKEERQRQMDFQKQIKAATLKELKNQSNKLKSNNSPRSRKEAGKVVFKAIQELNIDSKEKNRISKDLLTKQKVLLKRVSDKLPKSTSSKRSGLEQILFEKIRIYVEDSDEDNGDFE